MGKRSGGRFAIALALLLSLLFGSPATAGEDDGVDSGATCQPFSNITVENGYVIYHGYTYCTNLTDIFLKITYGPGETGDQYSPTKRCQGPLVGPEFAEQFACATSGIRIVEPVESGTTKYCMNTWLQYDRATTPWSSWGIHVCVVYTAINDTWYPDDYSGGGDINDSGGGSAPVRRGEPAMMYDQGNASMKIYRWYSADSGFGRLSDYQSGSYHLSQVGDRVASGDVDGDGKDDVVAAYQENDGTFSFFVFKRGINGAGRWYTSGSFNLTSVGGRLVVADFTGDGKAEPALVRDNGDGTMKIYRWQSTGSSFTRLTDYQSGSFHLGNVGNRVAAGDVDKDGKADIVMAYQLSDGTFAFYVFRSGITSLGQWYKSGQYALGPVAGRLVVADFTGDGDAEPALVRDNGDGTMRIYRWTSTGSSFTRLTDYQSGSFHLGNVGDRVAAADVTGDSKADIVIAYQNSNGTATLHVFGAGKVWLGRWYTGGQYNLNNVAGRLVVGNWY